MVDCEYTCMVFRDIPMPLVSSGVEHGNLRELALARMKDLGTKVRHLVPDCNTFSFQNSNLHLANSGVFQCTVVVRC